MGNENSQLAGLEIDEKAVEITDFWTHHSAVLNSENVTPLSIFIGDPLVGGSLWMNQTPLEKSTKNLMLHRHPSILKYISSWHKGSKLHLAVEYVKPLAHVLSNQTTLQICIGLHSVLKAVIFLHEKAFASHNNICTASIYVTQNGSWKLGGLEYLCRFKDMTLDYLAKTRMHRYGKAIDPVEEKNLNDEEAIKCDVIDKYSFGVLVEEVLHNDLNDENVPRLKEFKQFCKTELQNENQKQRPSLNSLLEHPFFTHEFIVIYSFLTELALKPCAEKSEFFTTIVEKIRKFPEDIVARQLGELLLSRLVLLDQTARTSLLPYILVPKQDNEPDSPIFSVDTFKQNIIPRLLHIFCVRDAQIRLLLLTHFKKYMNFFTKEQLQSHILPELLIGIKDTNDHLVSVTLIALSDLVPILGAATVVGGKRAKLFNDGRPIPLNLKKYNKKHVRKNEHEPIEIDHTIPQMSGPYLNHILELPERPSPDGGEDEISTTEVDQSVEDDLDNWSDWDVNDANFAPVETQSNNINVIIENTESLTTDIINNDIVTPTDNLSTITSQSIVSKTLITENQLNKKLPDILELDIKNQIQKQERQDEFDFFQDMEPVIEKANMFIVKNDKESDDISNRMKLNMNVTDTQEMEEGWNEDLDW